jgi:uncharacterized protein (TIGR03437 family)
MGGVQVIFQPGGVAAPLIYVSATQINCLVPYAVLGATTLQAQVNYLGQASNAYPLQFAETQPGIFTALATGTGLAIAEQYDAQGNYQGQNSSSNPAGVGWYLVFYVTGEGIIPSPAITGQVTSSANVIPLLGPPTVLIDNQPSTVPYFGEADGFVSGLMQVNASCRPAYTPARRSPYRSPWTGTAASTASSSILSSLSGEELPHAGFLIAGRRNTVEVETPQTI